MLDFLHVNPVAFTIPIGNGFAIYWYGIIVTLGIAAGAWWAGREIERRGGSADELYNGLLIVVIAGYAFARGWYVLQDVIAGNGANYSNFGDVINIRAGGANILGGFAGAVIVAFLYLRWRKLDYWIYADVAGPALLIAQAIGRWGNFINQELYGPPTSMPWGILIEAKNRIAPYNDLTVYPEDVRFHPTFLYESILLLIGFFVLRWLSNRYREEWKKGTLFGVFLMWWGVGRFFVEFFRPDQPAIGDGPITYSMLISLIFAVVGLYLVLSRMDKLPESPAAQRRRRRRVRKPRPERSGEPEIE
ncbi:MAG: prolipoprotein diacylglyceryl transferase [Candidatus Promineifilaceae bacterium]